MGKTSIEWTDESWPLANGCRRKSPGCENCYAERLISTRLSKTDKYKGLAVFGQNGPRWTGDVRFWAKDLAMPLKLKKPSRIFVADMGDLFYEGFSNEEIAAVFGVMAATPRHTFQVLTKRAERMSEWFKWAHDQRCHGNTTTEIMRSWAVDLGGFRAADGSMPEGPGRDLLGYDLRWPLPNVHLGVSVENQKYADERIPILLETPAAVHWVSAEPLLGPVDLRGWIEPCRITRSAGSLSRGRYIDNGAKFARLEWIVVGGESGPGARPYDVQWARAVIEQCQRARVPCFHKQLGAKPYQSAAHEGATGFEMKLENRKGGDWSEWPEDLRVRQFPRGAP